MFCECLKIFNVFARKTFPKHVRGQHQRAFNSIEFCHGQLSLLDCEGDSFESICGVQQGIVFSPLPFSLVLSSITGRIRHETFIYPKMRLCDAGMLIDTHRAVQKTLKEKKQKEPILVSRKK